MKISVPVNHNFYEECPITEASLGDVFEARSVNDKKKLQQLFSSVYELKLGANQLKQIKLFNFKRKHFTPDEERLILRLYSKENFNKEKTYFIQTGLYAGVLYYKNCKFNITTRYGDVFLKRMLNFVNDIYVDTEETNAKKEESDNQFLFILSYLFIQTLEKAAVLGLPQHYQQHQDRNHKVRGSINFNEFLKRDIPFQGKITSKYRERVYVQEIVDVIYLTLKKLDRLFGKEIHKRLFGLSQVLKQHYSGRFITYGTIQIAKNHSSINNPMYSGFKKVLEYAELILLNKDIIPENDKLRLTSVGYLFDISELFELYLEKLLTKNFPEWKVSGQIEVPIYNKQFYKRSLFPDLVMKNKLSGKLVVFDAKFKSMQMNNKDVDRSDLHQIHSYSGYYKEGLVASGLIYPLTTNININNAHSNSTYGNELCDAKFIVDGIYVKEDQSMKDLMQNEEEFVNRIKTVIN